jgi:hypothetical protein
MKLRLKYYKVIVVITLWLCCLVLPFVFASTLTLSLSSNKELGWLILWGLSLLYSAIRLGYMILFEFYEIEFTQTTIKLKNVITRKETFIETCINKFKINPITGKLSLVDNEGDVIVILNAFHYFNVPEALDYLNLRRNLG